MIQDAGKLVPKARFWASAYGGDKFIWLWFIQYGDELIVVEEKWRRGEKSEFTLYTYPIEMLFDLLEDYWRGARTFDKWELENLHYVELNWTVEELKEAEKWWRKRKELREVGDKRFIDGIRKGYYLTYGIT
jgi:hypothetical protein